VTIARSLSDTFAGIRPADAPLFILAQVLGALAATFLFRWLVPSLPTAAKDVLVRHEDDNSSALSRRSKIVLDPGPWYGV